MKRKKHFFAADTLLLVLAAVAVTLAVLLCLARPVFLLPVGVVLLLVVALAALFLGRIRRAVYRVLAGRKNEDAAVGKGLSSFAAPVAVFHADTIVWYNDAFLREITLGADAGLVSAEKIVPGLDLMLAAAPAGQNIAVGRRLYSVYAGQMEEKGETFAVFIENTTLKTQAAEYLATRPAVVYFLIDTYDETLKVMREAQRARLTGAVEMALEDYIGKVGGFLRRLSNARFIAVVEERNIRAMTAARFDILDAVREIGKDKAEVTLSIGVGRGGGSFAECDEMARAALDMALGRGGDQAAVKDPAGFAFYGGVSQGVEKSAKVKSRVLASALRDIVSGSEVVLIMGHRDSDMDCIGAAVGMLRFCQLCGKPAFIVVDETRTLAGSMLDTLRHAGYGERILRPHDALAKAGERTLLIVVDTHMKSLLESEKLYAACGRVAVIDHHRRMVGHIDDALLFYHEPSASSACEMVSELLQYVGDENGQKLEALEAEMLLAGIMLDTRTFALNVGVRTFEAAAYLRRMGAKTAGAKSLFATSMDDYLYRCHLVSQAQIYGVCAVAISDQVPFECSAVAPQAANELLTIEGVEASLVAISEGDEVRISARSMGSVNVQLIMEKLGGGGHQTMAGAQLRGVTLRQAETKMQDAVAAYYKENGY